VRRLAALAAVVLLCGVSSAGRAQPAALALEAKIAMGDVRGRIDHFAYDAAHKRLFVAELGNNSVGVVDLAAGKVVRRLSGLKEPQGVAYHAGTDTLYVANAGDGAVRLYQGPELAPIGQIALGDDADNIRIDRRRDRLVVGYGSGGLAVIDPASRRKIGEVALKGHPESFQFDEAGERIFTNVPDARQIAVVDLEAGRQTTTLDLAGLRSNFPMAVDGRAHRLLVVTRSPARLLVYGTADGKLLASPETCGDADDVFVDDRRNRVYVSCGEGVIDVLEPREPGYTRLARISTSGGARTSLFVPETDRLYLGVRAGAGEVAALWVFRPAP
jgi:DNA-binding beta-propeller fold protein YncE